MLSWLRMKQNESFSYRKETFDSRQLHAFRVLARTGSFTQTARELALTQSGISHSMKSLEREAGCRLLDRLGKTVVLTQAGEQLLPHAEKILAEMAAARDALGALDRGARGRLRLGAGTTACQHLIPPVGREFKQRFPEHALTLEPGGTPELVTALLQQRIDLALALKAAEAAQLEFHPLFTDELQFIVPARHPWARTGKVARNEIPGQSYILHRKQSVTFRLIENYFRREEMGLNTVLEAGSVEAAQELVKLGLGVGILAPWTCRRELAAGSLIALPLGRRKLSRRWGILHWRGKGLTPAEKTFIGLCESACVTLGL